MSPLFLTDHYPAPNIELILASCSEIKGNVPPEHMLLF